MMWKESYKIGVEIIDVQHKELFRVTEQLLDVVLESDYDGIKHECIQMITFLKDYVIKHFTCEEAYQESINYRDITNHKLKHKEFIDTVLEIEQELIETDFGYQVVQKFTGLLISWLTYHVAGVDQGLVKDEKEEKQILESFEEAYKEAAVHTIHTMTKINAEEISDELFVLEKGDAVIKVGLIGASVKEVVFRYSEQFILHIFKIITGMEIQKIDETVLSAMCEMSNIISGKALSTLSYDEMEIDIRSPILLHSFEEYESINGYRIETEKGGFSLYLADK